MALWKATASADESRAMKAFFWKTVNGAILDYVRKNARTVRISKQTLRKLRDLHNVMVELHAAGGKVTEEEIAMATRMPIEKVRDLMDVGGLEVSLTPNVERTLNGVQPDQDARLLEPLLEKIHSPPGLSLTEREKDILKRRLNGEQHLAIGRMHGISRGRVWQILIELEKGEWGDYVRSLGLDPKTLLDFNRKNPKKTK